MEKKPRDKQPRSQHPLARVPGEKRVLNSNFTVISLTAFEEQKIYFYLFIFFTPALRSQKYR